MFAEFDYSDYDSKSIVKVKLNKTIENDPDFYDFTVRWLNLYELKKDFTFIFDAENVGFVNIKYSIKMALFIRSLKSRPKQYLQKSIIIINNGFARRLLDLIFAIQSPVAPVYIIKNDSHINSILENHFSDVNDLTIINT